MDQSAEAVDHRIDELFHGSTRLQASGRMDLALPLQREALELLRERRRTGPEDVRVVERLASMLYSTAASLTDGDQYDIAVAYLEESEQLYDSLQGLHGRDTTALIADVRCRRAHALAARGSLATGFLTMDEAIHTFERLGARDPQSRHFLDLARVFAMNAEVLSECEGDPDLAVASADAAIRCYLHKASEVNDSEQAAMHNSYFQRSLAVASKLHGNHGRWELALQVDDLAIRSAPMGAELARAQARKAVHLRAAGRAGEAAVLVRAVPAETLADLEYELSSLRRGVPLRSAIDHARAALGSERVPEIVDALLTDPTQPEAGYSVSARCPSSLMPQAAELLVRAALGLEGLAPRHRRLSSALAFEAHLLFAVASREQVPVMRYELHHYGVFWARALMLQTRKLQRFTTGSNRAMAEDLAGWLRGLVLQLGPYAVVDRAVGAVVEEADELLETLDHRTDRS